MDGELDVYVWSIEDKHFVRVDMHIYRFTAACFTDVQVARKFRDWLATLPGLDDLVLWLGEWELWGDAVQATHDLIIQRRRHPAQLWRENGFGSVEIIGTWVKAE